MPGMPLSKCYQPTVDYPNLAEVLGTVDQYFTRDSPQSEHRRFEYGIALAAIQHWYSLNLGTWAVVDVGGAGSPFWRMVPTPDLVSVIDPYVSSDRSPMTLAEYLRSPPARLFPIVTCLSVIEHVDNLEAFLYHLSCLVMPGGLLVITTDICDTDGSDTRHFHWLRKRIFTPATLYDTADYAVFGQLADLGFGYYGGCDPVYHGDQLYGGGSPGHPTGYSLASLVLSKRE